MDNLSGCEQFSLHSSFSIKDCTYSSGSNGVIYSPFNSETLLCDLSVIRFLSLLESHRSRNTAIKELTKSHHPSLVAEVLTQLKAMRVIQVQE